MTTLKVTMAEAAIRKAAQREVKRIAQRVPADVQRRVRERLARAAKAA